MSTETNKVYSGDQIKGLFSKPSSSEVTIKSKEYGTLKFTVKPMDNDIYARMGEAMKMSGLDMQNLNPSEGMRVFSQVYYPAMKVVLPACCVEPKIVDGVSNDAKTLDIKTVPPEVCMDLLNEIMAVSGLGGKVEDETKNS